MKMIRFFVEQRKRGFADPAPTKSFIPEWYKKAESEYLDSSGQKELGLKTCMPYLDTLTTGYMLSTPVNIYVNQKKNDLGHIFNDKDGTINIRWDGPPAFEQFIGERPKESGATMPRPPGHYDTHLVFQGFAAMKTPRNYSILMTQPLNRHDLPFTIASGIIDSDKFFAPGNVPFFLKKDFSGVIPKGTPFAQLIPIKRDTWTSYQHDPYLTEKDIIQGNIVREKETNYKKKMWQRKNYS